MAVIDSVRILMNNIYRMIKTTLSARSPTLLLLFISLLLNPLIRCFAVDRKSEIYRNKWRKPPTRMLAFEIDKNGSIYCVKHTGNQQLNIYVSLELHHTGLFIQTEGKRGCEDRNGVDIVQGSKSRIAWAQKLRTWLWLELQLGKKRVFVAHVDRWWWRRWRRP